MLASRGTGMKHIYRPFRLHRSGYPSKAGVGVAALLCPGWAVAKWAHSLLFKTILIIISLVFVTYLSKTILVKKHVPNLTKPNITSGRTVLISTTIKDFYNKGSRQAFGLSNTSMHQFFHLVGGVVRNRGEKIHRRQQGCTMIDLLFVWGIGPDNTAKSVDYTVHIMHPLIKARTRVTWSKILRFLPNRERKNDFERERI
jgi:hypothetical protein